MPTLLLKFAGPIQSWGDRSKFEIRKTQSYPTKSAVIGLLASALGRDREEDISDLAALEVGVRIDHPGHEITDFHVVQTEKQSENHLTRRMYLCDAVFLVGISSQNSELINRLAIAVTKPAHPLFLGRRSCVPELPIYLGIEKKGLLDSLKSYKSLLGNNYGKDKAAHDIYGLQKRADIFYEVKDYDRSVIITRDQPVSFNPSNIKHCSRFIKRDSCLLKSEQITDPSIE